MAKKGTNKVGKGNPPKETRFKKGQSGNPAGKPLGAKSFKTILDEELSRIRIIDGEKISLKDLTVRQLIAILTSDKTDAATKLKAFQVVRDTIGEAPTMKQEITGADGGPIQAKWVIEVPAEKTEPYDPGDNASY